MLDDAVKDRRLARTQPRGRPAPAAEDRAAVPHPRQLAELADGCGPYRLLVLVLGYTGLRWGEAAALRVRRVTRCAGGSRSWRR